MIWPARNTLIVVALLLLGAGLLPVSVLSQSRNSFPGRRIGGGTRGECSARQIINLVPESSVFAPGPQGLIGWLEGPSPDPKPTEVLLRKQNTPAPVLSHSSPSTGSRLVLLRLPQALALPLVWESSFQCGDASAKDEFGFIGAEGPPAISLLVVDSAPADSAVQSYLKEMLNNCGSNTSAARISSLFELGDVLSSRWPEVLPVVCL